MERSRRALKPSFLIARPTPFDSGPKAKSEREDASRGNGSQAGGCGEAGAIRIGVEWAGEVGPGALHQSTRGGEKLSEKRDTAACRVRGLWRSVCLLWRTRLSIVGYLTRLEAPEVCRH